jgi:hypothetical protein
MPFTTEISGLIPAQFTGSDYTNPLLIQAFITSLTEFYAVKTGSSALTATDVQNIQNQINFLVEVARNGVSINLDPNNPSNPLPDGSAPGIYPNQTYYLTTNMVEVLNRLFGSIAPNGNLDSITLADLNNFRNGTTAENTSDIQNIFVFAARSLAVLPPLTSTSGSSAISTDPLIAATQIARIYDQSRIFNASTINESMTRSLQAFTEMEYVNTANEVINDKLEALREALQSTKSTLDNLNQLQQIHNLITVNSRTFTYVMASTTAREVSLNTYTTNYEKYASAQLKAALVPQLNSEFLPFSLPDSAIVWNAPVFHVSPGNPTVWSFSVTILNPSAYYAFNTSTNQFSAIQATYNFSGYYPSTGATVDPSLFTHDQIKQLVGDGFNGVQKFPLIGNLSDLDTMKEQLTRQRGSLSSLLVDLANITSAAILNDPLKRSQALIGMVSAVYTDLINNLGAVNSTTPITDLTAKTAVRTWIMDNYQSFASSEATSAGAYQQNITNAITAAQSTNDTQKQDVRNSLLVFEEYYKSAAAVLTQLNQLISKMAQGIAK